MKEETKSVLSAINEAIDSIPNEEKKAERKVPGYLRPTKNIREAKEKVN